MVICIQYNGSSVCTRHSHIFYLKPAPCTPRCWEDMQRCRA